jgi:O-antigen/teichoic acid export membrane protein
MPRLSALNAAIAVVAVVCWPGLTTYERIVLGILALTRVLDILRGPWLLEPQLRRRHLGRAFRELTVQFITAAAVIGAVVLDADAVSVALGSLGASSLMTVAVVVPRRASSERRERGSESSAGLLVAGLGFASSSILYSAINTVGLALMPMLASTGDVARFRAAVLVYSAALVLPIAINNDVLRPHLYRSSPEEGAPRVPSLRGSMLTINLVLASAVSAALLLAGRFLVDPLFGSEYHAVKTMLVPLALSVPFAFLSSYVANLLIVRGQLRAVVWVQLAVLAIAVIANGVLISVHGALGGAMALLVVDAVSLATYLFIWQFHPQKRRSLW